jgi:hypothetical protein
VGRAQVPPHAPTAKDEETIQKKVSSEEIEEARFLLSLPKGPFGKAVAVAKTAVAVTAMVK